MKPAATRLVLFIISGLAAVVVGLRLHIADAPLALPALAEQDASSAAAVSAVPTSTAGGSTTPVPARLDSRWLPLVERTAYAGSWDGPLPPELAAFRDWANRYLGTRDPAVRSLLETEGVPLARERRTVMRRLLEQDPQRALASTVPAVVRQALPPSIIAQLEDRISGTGTYALFSEPVGPVGAESRRLVTLGGVSYVAHAYGRRADQLTKEGASLHGIALDGHLALHESPLRLLDAGEISGRPIAATTCPVTGQIVNPPATGASANTADPTVVEVHGRLWRLASPELLPSLEQQLIAAEARPGPRVAPLLADGGPSQTSGPQVAELPATSWTTGTKKILVLRVDFSDVSGESVSAAAAQAVLDNEVRPFYGDSSYGAATLSSTVSTQVFRLPQTAATYATAGKLDHFPSGSSSVSRAPVGVDTAPLLF